MADRNDASSGMIASGMISSGGGTERAHTTGMAERRGGSVVAEFMDAARSAAESLLEEQKRQIANRISGVAEALRCAEHPLGQSENRVIARYIAAAANQVENVSHAMRERGWSELVADAEDFSRRNPTLFVLSSAAVGFVFGRLLWTSTAGRHHQSTWSSGASEPARTVTAAVASGAGTASGELSADTGARAGATEAR